MYTSEDLFCPFLSGKHRLLSHLSPSFDGSLHAPRTAILPTAPAATDSAVLVLFKTFLKKDKMMKLQPNYSGAGDVVKEEGYTNSLRSWLQWSYFWGNMLFLACIVVQVFLAGLDIMVSGSFLGAHKTFGYLIIWFPLVLLILGLAGRLPRSIIWLTVLLAILAFLQPVLIKISSTTSLPVIAALHPVNALAIFTLPLFLSYRVWQFRRR